MMDLLEKLKATHLVRHEVELLGCKLVLRILTEKDRAEAGLAAHDAFVGVEMNLTSADLHETRLANELLARAVLDPATGQPVFATAGDLEVNLSRDQKGYLLSEYLAFEREYSPTRLSDAEFDALLAEVKKRPQIDLLNNSSIGTLKRLVITLASPPST